MAADQPAAESRTNPRICRDPLTGRPVFVAPQRSGKPDDRALAERSAAGDGPQAWCPFCAGNESRTPPDLVRMPAAESLSWRSRIVPNTFPITLPQTMPTTGEPREAGGLHDVVIESPRHDRSILAIDPGDWRDVWAMCHRRLAMAAVAPSVTWATVFKNSGPKAGASLEHVHSQIVGLDLTPPVIEAERAAVERDPDVFLRLIAEARRDGRVVVEQDGLVALVPPAPRQPYETWLVVDTAEPFFHDTAPALVAAVADLTRDVVARLDRLAPSCHYNWWLHQPPFTGDGPAAGWHWHLEILPRLSELAGFEVGTGCHITTVTAETSAARLRAAGG